VSSSVRYRNFDSPWGSTPVTSITVAPSKPSSDVEYQEMRDRVAFSGPASVDGNGGDPTCQFAARTPPRASGLVIEMNPRAVVSSALAPRATGFRSEVAARLAVGYTLDDNRTTSPK